MTMPMMRLMLMRMGSASSVAGVAGVAGARGGARRAAEFVQRQVRQHTARSRLTIEDHLIGVAQNTLHSFEIHAPRSEEHTSELQSLMRISYAVFCLKKKKNIKSFKTNKRD